MDEQPEQPKYRGSYRPARNPIVRPGETLTLFEILDRLPPPNPGFLADIERAQSEDLLDG